ncbi:MAG TPA: twin-arginine translocase subunit TatC [Actinomycetota bacterium]|nr:twin-arginine translocase subunit TatC [Actinomycetota bacterium]
MSLVDHLKELRHRLLICVWALVGGSVIGFILYEPAMRLIQEPYCDFLLENPDKAPFESEGCSLIFLGAVDGFLITVKVIVFLALVVALPVLLYQLWAFIVPGLTSRERRWALPFVALSVVLFLLGGFFAYLTLPKALGFLLSVGGDFVSPLLTVDKYVGFVIFTILAFGLAFEFPILLISLSAAGVLSTDVMRRYRRQVILGLSIFAAVITPSPDPISMLALLIPLYLFYEGAIIVSRLLKR